MPADHYSYPQYRIIQYAKSPRLGQVKTRLRPALGDAGCLQLHRQLLEYCFHNLSNARVAPYSLSVSGEPCGYFDRLVAHSDVDIQRQQGADLGQRLQHSATQALASADGVIFIGSDCPFIDADYLHRACAALQRGHDCVLGPASDGGYVLIGFRQVRTEMFVDIPWGSGQVLDITR
ncbi:MAG: TIGR04282 family arsenosugar biosynthesis glycosyltransferase, partial [Porticoccaceae bacterium]|nr:TIGR04282 family arsenosugar biosynthesis glycosyltransferase [Porticoccaceae bacterium]